MGFSADIAGIFFIFRERGRCAQRVPMAQQGLCRRTIWLAKPQTTAVRAVGGVVLLLGGFQGDLAEVHDGDAGFFGGAEGDGDRAGGQVDGAGGDGFEVEEILGGV